MRTFNYRKYIDLAFSSKPGKKLLQEVETHWAQWVEIVEQAPWYVYWRELRLHEGCTPAGKLVASDGALVAERIFAAVVWGFGANDWIHREASVIQREMLRLQGKAPSTWNTVTGATRLYIWDTEYRDTYGIFLPYEVAALDRWLESLV